MEKHTTVLLTEAVDALAIREDSIVVDATLGAGGHAHRIISLLGTRGTYIGIDADHDAIRVAKATLVGKASIKLLCGNFKDIDSILNTEGITQVNAIIADLGWRIEQFTGNDKGFSFRVDEPLIMTYGDQELYPFTAIDIVNEWEVSHIEDILVGYGEERYARRISRAIVEARAEKRIETTFDLVSIIESVVPSSYRHGRIHPATRTFQALRMTVNDELGVLTTFLNDSIIRLAPRGRLAIITFHSLEDRVVKHTFRSFARDHIGTIVTKKPIVPTRDEIMNNSRSRSAKLRVFEKHEDTETTHSTI
jgi:16S rRNA (cytosine1402-N4)-methyltransferase